MKRKSHLCLFLFLLCFKPIYAEMQPYDETGADQVDAMQFSLADTSNDLQGRQIDATDAGGDKQVTIIDENGNLKMIDRTPPKTQDEAADTKAKADDNPLPIPPVSTQPKGQPPLPMPAQPNTPPANFTGPAIPLPSTPAQPAPAPSTPLPPQSAPVQNAPLPSQPATPNYGPPAVNALPQRVTPTPDVGTATPQPNQVPRPQPEATQAAPGTPVLPSQNIVPQAPNQVMTPPPANRTTLP